MRDCRGVTFVALCLIAALAASAAAQSRKLRIVSGDSVPISYAFVTVEGGTGQISDDHGEISLGAGKRKTVAVVVRRIGYQPWSGKLDLPDTAVVLPITLVSIAQSLSEVRVTGQSNSRIGLKLQGFYDRWLMRQKGLLSAQFIGPEEIEFRHPDKVSTMVSGLNGVVVGHGVNGDAVLAGYNGMCPMAVVVDGVQQCPQLGCKCASCGANMPDFVNRMGSGSGPGSPDKDANKVLIDRILDINSVTAIEIYARGGNMPTSLQVSDPGCGVIAFWTGSRKP
jgi:hypothetical protein